MLRLTSSLALGILALFALADSALSQAMSDFENPAMRHYHKANRYFEARSFDFALHNYRQAASWGHKISQFNVGTLYYNGHGVEHDPAVAWAWFELAAERDYPQMVDVADETWQELDREDRVRGAEKLEELRSDYADEITLPRLERLLKRHHRAATGSRLGGPGSSPVTIFNDHGLVASGDVYFDEAEWSVDELISREKALFEQLARARVRILDLKSVEETEAHPPD